jgi:hypothetical protein
MSKIIKICPGHPLIGTWVTDDEYGSEVEYTIAPAADGFAVTATTTYDGEFAEIYDVKWDGDQLAFSAYWNSSGRFCKGRFLLLSENRVEFTFTYTDHEVLHRKTQELATVAWFQDGEMEE